MNDQDTRTPPSAGSSTAPTPTQPMPAPEPSGNPARDAKARADLRRHLHKVAEQAIASIEEDLDRLDLTKKAKAEDEARWLFLDAVESLVEARMQPIPVPPEKKAPDRPKKGKPVAGPAAGRQ